MPRLAPWAESQARIVKTCGKTGGISARIGRTVKEIVAIFGKTTEIFETTVRICDKTSGVYVMTGNNCSMMNALGPAPDNSNRTGNRCATTVKISGAIVGISEGIARTGEAIGMISEEIDGICVRIGRT
jgi:hypothetical protein